MNRPLLLSLVLACLLHGLLFAALAERRDRGFADFSPLPVEMGASSEDLHFSSAPPQARSDEASSESSEGEAAPDHAEAIAEQGGNSNEVGELPPAKLEAVMTEYARKLHSRLAAQKEYPVAARRLGKQGVVVLRFTLRRDGSVVSSQVVHPSSHEILNDSARRILGSIQNFEPFPEELKQNLAEFEVPVEYRL